MYFCGGEDWEHVNADNSTDYASEPVKVEKIYFDISGAAAVQSNTLIYDGTEKAPEFAITYDDEVLSEEVYEIETDLHKEVGTYTAIIKGKGDEHSLLFTIDNTFENELFNNKQGEFITTKKSGNGIGINSAKKIVERYHGFFSADKKEDMFCVSFMLNL